MNTKLTKEDVFLYKIKGEPISLTYRDIANNLERFEAIGLLTIRGNEWKGTSYTANVRVHVKIFYRAPSGLCFAIIPDTTLSIPCYV